MKYIKYGFLGLPLILIILIVTLSIYSRFVDPPQLQNNKLSQCPDSPNCVCSESYPNKNLQPIDINAFEANLEWSYLKSAVIQAGGQIQKIDDNYMWAIFITPFWGFVDDFEARLDTTNLCIHLRSASRVGKNDWGTNLKRINLILKYYQTLKQTEVNI